MLAKSQGKHILKTDHTQNQNIPKPTHIHFTQATSLITIENKLKIG